MVKRYYKLSNGTTGIPLASYARPQPNQPDLVHLDEAPSPEYVWSGDEWVFDLELYKPKIILELDQLYSKWFKFKRTLSPQNIRDTYWAGVNDITAATSTDEIDTILADIKLEVLT